MDQSIEMSDRCARLDSAELWLRDVQPCRDRLLRDGPSPVIGMMPVGMNHLAHVSAGKGRAYLMVFPELPWYVGRRAMTA